MARDNLLDANGMRTRIVTGVVGLHWEGVGR